MEVELAFIFPSRGKPLQRPHWFRRLVQDACPSCAEFKLAAFSHADHHNLTHAAGATVATAKSLDSSSRQGREATAKAKSRSKSVGTSFHIFDVALASSFRVCSSHRMAEKFGRNPRYQGVWNLCCYRYHGNRIMRFSLRVQAIVRPVKNCRLEPNKRNGHSMPPPEKRRIPPVSCF